MEEDGSCKTDTQNKKDRVGEGRIILELIKKNGGATDLKELPAEGCSRRNGERNEGSRQKKISDNRQHHDKCAVCRYEKEG